MQPPEQTGEREEGVEGENNVLPKRRQAQHRRHQGQVYPVESCPDHGRALDFPADPNDSSSSGPSPPTVYVSKSACVLKPSVTTC